MIAIQHRNVNFYAGKSQPKQKENQIDQLKSHLLPTNQFSNEKRMIPTCKPKKKRNYQSKRKQKKNMKTLFKDCIKLVAHKGTFLKPLLRTIYDNYQNNYCSVFKRLMLFTSPVTRNKMHLTFLKFKLCIYLLNSQRSDQKPKQNREKIRVLAISKAQDNGKETCYA